MNHRLRSTLILTGICSAFCVPGLLAQAPVAAPSVTPSVSVPAAAPTGPGSTGNAPGQGHERMREALAALTPQERQELKAAREKALTDPAVKAAEPQRASDPRVFRRVMVEAMLRADPNVAGILKKMRGAERP